MVTMVLLNVERMCAMPDSMFFLSRRFVRVVFLAFSAVIAGHPPFRFRLLVRLRAARSFARAGVGSRALAADRQALALADAAVAADFLQPLDVHRGFAAKIA